MILRDLSRFCMLVNCLLAFIELFNSRFSRKKTMALTGIFSVFFISLNLWTSHSFGEENAGRLLIATFLLPAFLFFALLTKRYDSRFLTTFFMVSTFALELLLITSLFSSLFGERADLVLLLSRMTVFPIFVFLTKRCLSTKYQLLQQKVQKGWPIFAFFSVAFFIFLVVMAYYPTRLLTRPDYYLSFIMVLCIFPLMCNCIFTLLWHQMKRFEAEEERRRLSAQLDTMNERTKALEASEQQIKILRHDLRHHVILLNSYLEENDIQKAKSYLKKLSSILDRATTVSFCKNSSINAVLSFYNLKAEENDIRFSVSTPLDEPLHVPETDFALILSNALDNAFNAIKNAKDKWIEVKAFIENGKLFLEVKNPFSGELHFTNGIPDSMKEGHGFGTKSMALLIDKNSGIYSFVAEEGIFVFRCAM